jgi:Rrf2 family nitric oxide-sensitive transcriptional repressor
MHLTRFTDLGLRTLMYLAQHEGPESVTNALIARQFQVPHNHVIKVVHRLGKLGWVHTKRGRHGGLQLAALPHELRLGEVVRGLEETSQLVDCHEPPCVLKSRCLLRSALDDALSAFYEKLDQRTLADMIKAPTGGVLLRLSSRRAR